VYRDKEYFGTIPFASIDKTMKKSVRGKPITIKEKRRNNTVSRVRALLSVPMRLLKEGSMLAM